VVLRSPHVRRCLLKVAQPPPDVSRVLLAPHSRRMAAFIIDFCVVVALEVPFLLATSATGTVPGGDNFNPFLWMALGLGFFGAVLVLFAHFDGSTTGASPGKYAMRIRVADQETGEPIGFRRGVVRRRVWILGLFPFYLGLLWAFGNARHQGWHDKAAHDLVVEGRI